MFAYLHEKTQPYGEVKRIEIDPREILKSSAYGGSTSGVTYVEGDSNIKKSIEVLETPTEVAFWKSLTDVATAGTLAPAVSGTIAGAGTTQGTATAVAKYFTYITGAAGSGVILPAATADAVFVLRNDTAGAIIVYPATGEKINGGTVNVGYSIPAYSTVSLYTKADATKFWFTII